MDGFVLQLDNYAAGYHGHAVFAPITVSVRAGTFCLIQGANGVGKSTLLRGIAGLCAFEQGGVRLLGRDLYGLPANLRLGRGIAYLSQLGGVFESLTIDENVILSQLLSDGQKRSLQREKMAIRILGTLKSRGKELVGALSGGERRIVAVARAVAADTQVILLDEPLAGLSASLRAPLIDMIVEVIRGANLGALWVEHTAPELEKHASEVLEVAARD